MSIFSRKKLPGLTALHEELGEVLKTPDPETELGGIIYRAEKTPEKPPAPEPDLSTKPKDIVGYCFGFACPKKHVQFTFESITVDDFKRRQACDTCGAVAKPAVVKRIAPPEWVASGKGMWRQYYLLNMGGSLAWEDKTKPRWSVYEFFHYLETPKRRKK